MYAIMNNSGVHQDKTTACIEAIGGGGGLRRKCKKLKLKALNGEYESNEHKVAIIMSIYSALKVKIGVKQRKVLVLRGIITL